MSVCDSCIKPGSCCKGLYLSAEPSSSLSFWADEHPLAALVRMVEMDLPFVPAKVAHRYTDEASGREYVTYRYDCTMLGDDGRCTIYEDRPQLCRAYEPKSDALCIMHEPQP